MLSSLLQAVASNKPLHPLNGQRSSAWILLLLDLAQLLHIQVSLTRTIRRIVTRPHYVLKQENSRRYSSRRWCGQHRDCASPAEAGHRAMDFGVTLAFPGDVVRLFGVHGAGLHS